jgi:hypothetical protein
VSIEFLLLIAFILLPLIQQLLRAARERAQGEPKQPAGPAPRARGLALPGPTPPSQVALPPALAAPPAVPAKSPVPSMAVPSRTTSRSTREAVIPVSTARRSVQQRGTLRRFLGPHDLRGAIVLMTILGPCRAIAGGDGAGLSAVDSPTGLSNHGVRDDHRRRAQGSDDAAQRG